MLTLRSKENAYASEIEGPDDDPARGAKRSPLIVYFHGIREGGGQTRKVRTHGPWKDLDFNVKAKVQLGRYFVVAPHLPRQSGQWDVRRVEQSLLVAFAEIANRYGNAVDLNRVYVTGNSRGGRCALELASRGFPSPRTGSSDPAPGAHPFRAAAIIAPEEGARQNLHKKTSYQFFHRKHDYNRWTRDTYLGLSDEPRVAFHSYFGCNHNCWTATYANPNLYEWFENPDARPRWGQVCDAPMCVLAISDEIPLEQSGVAAQLGQEIRAPFCLEHANDFRRGKKPWVTKYKEKLVNVKG
jgi:hypothetical protein